MDDRMASAARFLLQSPPGEINDVLNGMESILFRRSFDDKPFCRRP